MDFFTTRTDVRDSDLGERRTQRPPASITENASSLRAKQNKPSMPKKNSFRVGDTFAVKLVDGSFGLAQVLGVGDSNPLGSIAIALLDRHAPTVDELQGEAHPGLESVYATLFTEGAALEDGEWPLLPGAGVPIPSGLFPGGKKVPNNDMLSSFASAFFGLAPWDVWQEGRKFDSMLISLGKKPHKRLVFKGKEKRG